MKVIIGLGNPGKAYEKTKHNVGFIFLDKLAQSLGIAIEKKAHEALVGAGFYQGKKILLVKPQTFMNLSGKAVWQVIDYYSDQIEEFIVIYDDMDTELGQFRFKKKGSAGGHNGIKSIISSLNSQEFDRLKIGIGQKKTDAVKHVLGDFSSSEQKALEEVFEEAYKGILAWLESDIDKAMNQYNRKK